MRCQADRSMKPASYRCEIQLVPQSLGLAGWNDVAALLNLYTFVHCGMIVDCLLQSILVAIRSSIQSKAVQYMLSSL